MLETNGTLKEKNLRYGVAQSDLYWNSFRSTEPKVSVVTTCPGRPGNLLHFRLVQYEESERYGHE